MGSAVGWYVAYPISYRQLSAVSLWTIPHLTAGSSSTRPRVEKQFRHRQRPVGRSWRLDETYVKIKGKWAYLDRAVDKEGHTIDFLLTPTRDRNAAEAFLHKASHTRGLPEKITIDHRSEWGDYGSHYALQ